MIRLNQLNVIGYTNYESQEWKETILISDLLKILTNYSMTFCLSSYLITSEICLLLGK